MNDFDTEKLCGAKTERGYNMLTSSGLPFWPADPRIEDIRIEDIADHLSRICRFNGALRSGVEHYSVAQHSIIVAVNVTEGFWLEGLLHDAAEAYIGDMIKPQKGMYAERAAIEDKIDAVIREKFKLPPTMSPEVKRADYIAVLTERRDVCNWIKGQVDWGYPTEEAWEPEIIPWSPSGARKIFLDLFYLFDELRGSKEETNDDA